MSGHSTEVAMVPWDLFIWKSPLPAVSTLRELDSQRRCSRELGRWQAPSLGLEFKAEQVLQGPQELPCGEYVPRASEPVDPRVNLRP